MQTKPESPFASVIGLGALKGEYAGDGRGAWVSLIGGLASVAAGLALFLFAANRGYDAYGSDALKNSVLVAALMIVGVETLIKNWRNRSVAAAVYERGVAYRNRGGVVQARWDEVDTVHQAVTSYYRKRVAETSHAYTVRTKTGQKIVLTTDALGENVEALGNEVQRGVAAALFPRYWQLLQSGQRVTFGPLAMDREKLYAGGKELRWAEVESIKITNRPAWSAIYAGEYLAIHIKKDKGRSNWANTRVARIPNLLLFCDLVSRYAKVDAGTAIKAALERPSTEGTE